MFVLTIDQRGSRRDVDRVTDLLTTLRDMPVVRAFQRTAGDEIQGVVEDATVAVDVALTAVDDGHWAVGIGAGPVELPLPAETRAGRGPAFEAARDAVERAKRALTRTAVTGPDTESAHDADTALALVAAILDRRSPDGRSAVALIRDGLNQTEAATHLGITKQAVSQRLAAAGWALETPGRTLAARLLERSDR
ncbi:hypothetical protein DW322_14070 [Rhodococcus rhodnii]|uniref:DNA-binding protein n=2 Tax=Rhodococcus rhodnii TaxID=38312 RepID=R7WIK3_9NOCA|nr:hypothetical protein [Rhodococcus rhodnii]EOM75035.1 hypothetical protein Rrhod_3648 [Rhodococcus rhodnii LMG 5362]TXG91139.1 hypothetical protein DW322_14070 [Rhodococcus rhodnii]